MELENAQLLLASRLGDGRLLSRMLHRGADASLTDEQGVPILHYWAARGASGEVLMLQRFGAKPDATDPQGRQAAQVALDNGHVGLSLMLRRACNPPAPAPMPYERKKTPSP